MIVRIVRMYFTEAGAKEFLPIFLANKEAIRHFPGCTHLELLTDPETPHAFATLSHWEKADDLESYRQSELFEKVWGSVKILFSERPKAFSLVKFIEL